MRTDHSENLLKDRSDEPYTWSQTMGECFMALPEGIVPEGAKEGDFIDVPEGFMIPVDLLRRKIAALEDLVEKAITGERF